jgi:sulfur-carrier protein
MVTVFIPEQLRRPLGGTSELLVEVTSIQGLIDHISTTYPEAIERIYRNGRVNPNVNVYVNGEDIRFLRLTETPLNNGDEVSLVAATAGG